MELSAETPETEIERTNRFFPGIFTEAFWEDIEYKHRGSPGSSLGSALILGDIYLCDELRSAKIRGDLECIQNIGVAAMIRHPLAQESAEIIRTGAAIDMATRLVEEFTNKQQEPKVAE